MDDQARTKPLVIVGLGNPGSQYQMTRHNAGFLVADQLAKNFGWAFKHEKHLKAALAKGVVGSVSVFILKPETYMNLSGHAVKEFLSSSKLNAEEIVVLVDDADLAFGDLRLKAFGGTGGHNGLKSIVACLGTGQFARLRIGIGRSDEIALVDYVLQPFSKEENKQLPEILNRAEEALHRLLKEPMANVMSAVNRIGENEGNYEGRTNTVI